MHDAGGNGQVNNTGEPVATGCGTGSQPTWLKVEKYGKEFIVYCSRERHRRGPRSASRRRSRRRPPSQDIGLFVVSHITGTKATAKFTDWSLRHRPGRPGPASRSTPAPGCAPARCRTSSTAALNTRALDDASAARRARRRGGGARRCPSPTATSTAPTPAPISYVGQAAPAGDWQATTKVTLDAGQRVAVRRPAPARRRRQLHRSSRSPGTRTDARFFEFWSETNGSADRRTATTSTCPRRTRPTIHLRLDEQRRRRCTASYSHDGDGVDATWAAPRRSRRAARSASLAAGDTDAQNKTAAFDWFRVTPGRGAARPGPERRVRRHRARRLPLGQDPRLEARTASSWPTASSRSTTFDADISGADNGPIENLILQTPPEGDWTVETKMTAPLQRQLAAGRLHALQRRRPLRQVRRRGRQRTRARRRCAASSCATRTAAALTGPGRRGPRRRRRAPTDTWWLRLTKTGNTYTGAISADGETWVQTPGSVTVAADRTRRSA